MLRSCQPTATIEWRISEASPIEATEIAPRPKSSGARMRRVPPNIVAIRLKRTRPKGTISASDMVIAKYIQPIEIGALSMFCIQERVPITAIAASEPITVPRWKSGRRAKAGMISARAPSAKIRTSM